MKSEKISTIVIMIIATCFIGITILHERIVKDYKTQISELEETNENLIDLLEMLESGTIKKVYFDVDSTDIFPTVLKRCSVNDSLIVFRESIDNDSVVFVRLKVR